MIDPAATLPSFQAAIEDNSIRVTVSKTDPKLFLAVDPVGEIIRLTYFRLKRSEVVGICMVVPNGYHNGIPCFDLGYAVVEKFRRRGLGSEIVAAAVTDHIAGMARAGVPKIYVEAVVGLDNIASQRVAERVLGGEREAIVDKNSGLPAYRWCMGPAAEA